MGFNVEDYQGIVDPAFLCTVCNQVLKDPVKIPCGHTFCRECIIAWIETSPSCPLDQQGVIVDNLSHVGFAFKSLLDNLLVKCGFSLNGCSYSGQRSSLVNHESSCPFNPDTLMIACDKGCGLTIQRSEFEDHCCLQYTINLLQDKTVTLAQRETEKDILQKDLERLRESNHVLDSRIRNLMQDNRCLHLLARHQWNQQDGIRRKTGKYPAMEEALINWIRYEAVNGLGTSHRELTLKALEIAQDLGLTEFQASKGWLERFRKRLPRRVMDWSPAGASSYMSPTRDESA
jgi:hypothetical protein